MNKENLPDQPEAELPKKETSAAPKASKSDTPKKNSNMRSRWKKSRHSQDKTPLIHTASSFGVVEQAPVPKTERQPEQAVDIKHTNAAVKAAKEDGPKKPIEKPIEATPQLQKSEPSEAKTLKRPIRTDTTVERPYQNRQSFSKRPLNKDYASREGIKTSMDYEPSRSSLQKKKSLEDAIMKTQEASLFEKIKKFFSRLFLGEPSAKPVQKQRPHYGKKNFYNNRRSHYSKNRNNRKDS